MAKYKDLQPWLEYFQMLHTYEAKGYLEVKPADHEAYITEPALISLSPTDDPARAADAMPATIVNLRVYAAYHDAAAKGAASAPSEESSAVSASGDLDYLRAPFALHVVKPDPPYDLLYTILTTRRRSWWKPWSHHDHFELIDYRPQRPFVVTPKQGPPTPPDK